MSKFTQGKWCIDRFEDIVDEHGGYIAQLHERFDNTDEEKQANSRLIAAAPPMYEMMKNLVNVLAVHAYTEGEAVKISQLLTRIDSTEE